MLVLLPTVQPDELEVLNGGLTEPVVLWRTAADLPSSVGTLVVNDAARLTPKQQQELLTWLDGQPREVQVISLASAPLYPLVRRRAFLEALYYRLNVVMLGGGERRSSKRAALRDVAVVAAAQPM